MKFINQDSLVLIQDSLKILDTLIYSNNLLIEVNEAIDALEDGEDGKSDLEDEKSVLENFIDGLTSRRETNNFTNYLRNTENNVSKIYDLLEEGSILINEIEHVDLGISITNEERLSDYSVTLSNTQETSSFNIDIDRIGEFNVVLEYDLFDELDADKRVMRRASNIVVSSSTFLEVIIPCDTAVCSDSETEITFHY